MRVVQFGGIEFPQFNATQQFSVPFRSSIVPLRGGGFDQDGGNTYLESKILNLNFWVSVKEVESIDDFIASLYTEASKGRRLLIARLRNDDLWQAEAKLVNASSGADARTYVPDSMTGVQGYERMQLAFEIPYPYWIVAEDAAKFLDEGWFMNSGITLDSGQKTQITTSSLVNTFTIDNNGGAAHQNCTLTIQALTGATLTDVLVENLTTGEQLEWEGSITVGEVLTIETLPQTIRLDGVDEYANTTLPTAQIGFWKLALGDNDFRITFTAIAGGNAQIDYAWARHYIR